MPRGDPFTVLCQQSSRLTKPIVADLHIHTTASDGEFTPQQVLAFAQSARLQTIAITDHDTLAGYQEIAQNVTSLQLIPGVEITTRFRDQEIHLLGYSFDPNSPRLNAALTELCEQRRLRFLQMVDRLAKQDVRFPPGLVENLMIRTPSLGRRHLANLLIQTGQIRTRFEAFRRYLTPLSEQVDVPLGIPTVEAIRWVSDAGGFSSFAHPRSDVEATLIAELAPVGLNAIEVNFPAAKKSHTHRLRELARANQLLITGGSDCHGRGPANSSIGSCGIVYDEFSKLPSQGTSREIPREPHSSSRFEQFHPTQRAE